MHHFTEKRDRSRAKERISEKGGEAEARGATRNENENERERENGRGWNGGNISEIGTNTALYMTV